MSLSQNQNPPNSSRTHCKRIRIPKDAVDFCKIGGLNEHLKTLREMIIFPLLQGSVYSHFNIKAPRGVLFYGPPGTGKTLVAAAIATEINKEGIGKVAFFQRKGADVLDKWVGGSEKNLRDLFEKATKARPSIIFFDEIDGLAPVREKQSDQIHSSVVATLLALMDGLDNKPGGQNLMVTTDCDEMDGLAPVREKQSDQIHSSAVATLLALMDGLDNKPGLIVIGATNRIEAVDPALRRPGRFDKELYFPLPGLEARKEILKVHIESWKHKPSEKLLTSLAHSTSSFSGADLQALCSEAVLRCMKRIYPSLQGIKVDPEKLKVEECDFLTARSLTVPSTAKEGQKMRKLTPIIQPLLQGQLMKIVRSIQTFWPHFLQENHKYIIGEERYAGRVLLIGTNTQGLNSHLVPAVLQTLEYLPSFVYDINFRKNMTAKFRPNFPSVILLSRIDEWWNFIGECEQLGIVSSLEDIHAGLPVLVIATCKTDIPSMLQEFFYNNSSIMLKIEDPTDEERKQFLKPLFFDRNIVSVYSVMENVKRGGMPGPSADSRMALKRKKSRFATKFSEGMRTLNTRSSKRKRDQSVNGTKYGGKRTKRDDDDYDLVRSNSSGSLYDIHKQTKREGKENHLRRCDSDTSIASFNNKSCFPEIISDLLSQRNSRYCDDPSTQSAIKSFLCEKTPRTQSKRELEVKDISEKSSTGDPQKRQIYNLWKHASLVTSRKMSVAQLELLYDVISACISIHWNSLENLMKNLEDILQNIENAQIPD